jgi:cyclopropane fatty-acyl-phospholipid synthase-like methyltransferase
MGVEISDLSMIFLIAYCQLKTANYLTIFAPMFNSKDIADYYNQTVDHYEIWWNLKKSMAVHYGFWDKNTKSFNEALKNTNREMAKMAQIKPYHYVLDAGCGVGGAAFYLASTIGCSVSGITLSDKQLKIANEFKHSYENKNLVDFSLQDFTNTNFKPESFDVIWGCESTCYASPKINFINEAKRLLKSNGILIIADYFVEPKGLIDKDKYIKNWGDLWAIQEFHSQHNFIDELEKNGFKIEQNIDVSKHIFRSSKRMYYSYLVGAIPSKVYNLFNNTSRFGKKHYQSGYFQYKALVSELWSYRMLVVRKK